MAEVKSDMIISLEARQGDVIQVLQSVSKAVGKLEKRVNEMGKETAKVAVKTVGSFTIMRKRIEGVSKKIGSAFGKIGAAIGIAGLTGVIYKSVNAAINFETKLKEVSTLLGGEASQKMQQYEQAIRDLALTTSASVEELTGGLYQVISAGVEGSETVAGAMRLVETAQKASVAGVSDTFSAVDVLTSSLNAYGKSTADAMDFSDKLFTAVKLGKCVVGSTRILLADGRYERIDKLKNGGVVVSFDGRNFLPMQAKWIDQGVKPIVRIRTRLGRQIDTTWNHPFLTKVIPSRLKSNPNRVFNHKATWKKVSELEIGDRIAVPTSLPYFGDKEVNLSEASLLGLWLAEGSCRTTTPRITSKKYGPEIEDWATDFGCKVKNVEKRSGKSPMWELSSGKRGKKQDFEENEFMWLLRHYGLDRCTSESKHVPGEVFTWSRECVSVFLRWLFNGDGWIADLRKQNQSGFQLGFASKSEQLVRDVSHLLLRFGIVGRVRYRKENNCWVWETNRHKEIARFVQFIGIDRPAAKLVLKHVPEKQRAEWGVVEFDKIISIEKRTKENVYDLMVEELHNFVAEDIIAHNTTFNELSAQIGMVASVAAGANVSFDEINAAIVSMTKGGLSTDIAVTALRATILSIIKPSTEMSKALKRAGFESGSAAIEARGLVGVMELLNEVTGGSSEKLTTLIPNVRAITGASILAGSGMQGFKNAVEEMGSSSGATEEAYGKMAETFEQKTKRFWNVVNEVFITIGKELLPFLLEKMEALSNWVTKNADEIVKWLKGAAQTLINFAEFIISEGPKIAMILASFWVVGAISRWITYVTEAGTVLKGFLARAASAGSVGGPLAIFAGGLALATGGAIALASALDNARKAGKKMVEDLRESFHGIGMDVFGKEADVIKDTIEAAEFWTKDLQKITVEVASATAETIRRQKGVIDHSAKEAKKFLEKTLVGLESLMARVKKGDFDKEALEAMRKRWAELTGGEPEEMPVHKETQRRARDMMLATLKERFDATIDMVKKAGEREEELYMQLENARKQAGIKTSTEVFNVTTAHIKALEKFKEKGIEKLNKMELRLLDQLVKHDVNLSTKEQNKLLDKYKRARQKMVDVSIKEEIKMREQGLKLLRALELANMNEKDRLIAKHEDKMSAILAMRGLNEEEKAKAIGFLKIKFAKDLDALVEKGHKKEIAAARKAAEIRYNNVNAWARRIDDGIGLERKIVDLRAKFGDEDEQKQAALQGIRLDMEKEIFDIRMAGLKLGVSTVEAEDLIRKKADEKIKEELEEPGWLATAGEKVATGFLEEFGSKLYDFAGRLSSFILAPFEQLSGLFMKPFDQITGLLGAAFSGEGIPKMREMLDGFLSFWDNLVANLEPVLEWLATEGIPRIIDAFVTSFPIIMDAIITNLPSLTFALIDGALQIVGVFIAEIPNIVDALIRMIPIIITAFIKNIPQLAFSVGKAIAEVFKNIVLGRWGGNTSWLEGEEGLLPDEVPILGKLHEGGMIKHGLSNFSGAVSTFMNAVKAHSGLYVKPVLQPDEIPIIGKIGEAVLNQRAVAGAGGEAGINHWNKFGKPPGVSGGDTHYHLHAEHVFAEKSADVIDNMEASMLRKRKGKVFSGLSQGSITMPARTPGFRSRRK